MRIQVATACGPSLGKPGGRNCQPYLGDTTPCTSSLPETKDSTINCGPRLGGPVGCTCKPSFGNTTLCKSSFGLGPGLGRDGDHNCHPYRGNSTLCTSSLDQKQGFKQQLRTWSGKGRGPQLSSLPREYNTLHIEFGPEAMDSSSNCGPGLGRDGGHNCHPYQGNTTLCTSSLDQKQWIQAATADLVWEGLGATIVILTEGIQHFAHRVWTRDNGFKQQLRTWSGKGWGPQLSSLPGEYNTLHIEFGPETMDSSSNCGPGLGRDGGHNCHPYRGNITLCTSSLDQKQWIQATTAALVWKGGGGHNCHPYRGNTTLCTSSLDEKQWIQAAPADLVWEGLRATSVILTEFAHPRNFSKLDLNRADVLCVLCVCVCVCVRMCV